LFKDEGIEREGENYFWAWRNVYSSHTEILELFTQSIRWYLPEQILYPPLLHMCFSLLVRNDNRLSLERKNAYLNPNP
jgi:hypothetical protein